jgi:hypothetical protein
MMSSSLYAAAIALAFFWCGCVAAISFLEAWLKFSAPGVTLPIGLSIGRLVFSALNKVEWVLAVATVGCLFAAGSWTNGAGWLAAAIVVLAVETVWLLPVLDKRALAYMSDLPPAPSSIHFVFVAAELVKIICLVGAGIKIFKSI